MKNQMDWIVSGVFIVFAIAGVIIWMQTKPIMEKPPGAATANVKAPLVPPAVTVVYSTSLPGASAAGGGGGGGGRRGGGGGGGGGGNAKFGGAAPTPRGGKK